MRLVKNKNGFAGLYTFIIMIVLIGLALFSSYVLNVDNLGSKENYIGKVQYDAFDTYYDYQFDLLYYDAISNLFIKDGLDLIAKEGAVDGSCGRYGYYNSWIGVEKNCTPFDNYDLGLLNKPLKKYTDINGNDSFYFDIKNNDTTISAYMLEEKEYSKAAAKIKERVVFDSYYSYDLGIYSKSYKAAEQIVDECVGYSDYEACVNSKFLHLGSINNIDFRSDCLKDSEYVFNEFVGQYLDCLDSPENDCACNFDMSADEGLVKGGTYKIVVNKNSILMGRDDAGTLEYEFENEVKLADDFSDVDSLTQIIYEIKYDSDGEVDKIMLDTRGSKKRINNIELYKSYSDQYYPDEWSAFMRDTAPKQECNIYNRYVDLCVNNKESEIEDVRFSVYIKDTVPPPDVENVIVTNVEDKEGKLKLVFDKFIGTEKVPVMDVEKYHFYVMKSDKEIVQMDVSNIEPNATFFADEISILPEAYFEVEDNTDYYFGVLAEDLFGNKFDVIKFYKGVSLDNLAPGNIAINEGTVSADGTSYRMITMQNDESMSVSWSEPKINIDGSKNKDDVKGYMIFNAKQIYDPEEILLDGSFDDVVSSCVASPVCTYVSGGKTAVASISLSLGENYIAVIPIDEAGNYPKVDSNSGAASTGKDYRNNINTYSSSGFASIMKAEGGWVSDPDDKGGETYIGITTYYNPDWPGWNIVRETRAKLFSAKDPYTYTREEVKRLNQELRASEELDSYVNQYYMEFQEKKGILKIASPAIQELAFNFILNTPKGALISLNKATGETLDSTGGVVTDALAAEINKIDVSDTVQAEEFGMNFADAMYDYYGTRQAKFRRGWYNRVKHGVNLYLEQVGSEKKISIETDGPVMS